MYSVQEVVIYIHDDHEWNGLYYDTQKDDIIEAVENLRYVESCEFFDSLDSMAVTIELGGSWYQSRVDEISDKIQAILDSKRITI
jgi:hypothetical protein